jgi:hypothetical protein
MSMDKLEPIDSRMSELHLSLNSDQVKQIKNLKPGKQVQVTVTGRIMSVSQGLEVSEDTKRKGEMCVEVHKLKVTPDYQSPFELLSEDD